MRGRPLPAAPAVDAHSHAPSTGCVTNCVSGCDNRGGIMAGASLYFLRPHVDYTAMDLTEGGTSIPYWMEDPFVREEYERMLAKEGVQSRMDPSWYERPANISPDQKFTVAASAAG